MYRRYTNLMLLYILELTRCVQVHMNTPAGKESSGGGGPPRGRKPRKGESSNIREEEEQEGYTHKTSIYSVLVVGGNTQVLLQPCLQAK